MPRDRSLSGISAGRELSVDDGYGPVAGDDVYGRKWVRQLCVVDWASCKSSMVIRLGRNKVHSADDISISHNDGKLCPEQPESPNHQV